MPRADSPGESPFGAVLWARIPHEVVPIPSKSSPNLREEPHDLLSAASSRALAICRPTARRPNGLVLRGGHLAAERGNTTQIDQSFNVAKN
jgi:hypothetical protein